MLHVHSFVDITKVPCKADGKARCVTPNERRASAEQTARAYTITCWTGSYAAKSSEKFQTVTSAVARR
jgi:hypothetical protein